ncbi:MAG: hypothetical protein AAB373_05005 [Patescibacteria group bacterium]
MTNGVDSREAQGDSIQFRQPYAAKNLVWVDWRHDQTEPGAENINLYAGDTFEVHRVEGDPIIIGEIVITRGKDYTVDGGRVKAAGRIDRKRMNRTAMGRLEEALNGGKVTPERRTGQSIESRADELLTDEKAKIREKTAEGARSVMRKAYRATQDRKPQAE